MRPKVSVVTVCFNAKATITNTIESVMGQTFPGYEYIIIDGASTDGTNHIIQSYLPLFQNKGISVKYLSEPDNGIYDAMNKGIRQADGEWITFMNADDKYHGNTVLADIFAECPDAYKEYEVLYGSANYITPVGSEIRAPLALEMLKSQVAFVHQSSFVKTTVMKQKLFDTKYRLAADYQFFLELWLKGARFMELKNCVVSDFSTCGRSTQMQYESIAELRKIRYLHNIPGNSRIKDWLDYVWWVAVHLGGRRIKQ